ncbi:MAG: glycosyltransferase [Sphaerochaetaceae bacterium]|nr:glycosyltransferase [Sphaerochaetaceae bacterium]
MPKITHFFKTYFPDSYGGLEEAIRQIGKFSTKKGYHVKVVSVSRKPYKGIIDGIEVQSYKKSFGTDSFPISISLIKNFRKEINDTDVIHLYYPYPLTEMLTLFSFTSKPIVITYVCDIHQKFILRLLYTPFINFLFKKADYIVPINENLYQNTTFLHKFNYKINVINLWIDANRVNKLNDILIKSSSITFHNKYALFIGVLRWYKGLDVLFDAAKNVYDRIIIIGKGPLLEHLKQRVINESISNIELLGYVEDDKMFQYIKNCSFLVLPSISPAEAFGQVLLEASFYSKPMITTELGTGTSYVNKNEETGIVVPPNNPLALSKAMNRLFSDDKLRISMGNAAKKRLDQYFTEEKQGYKYIDIYKSVLD